MKSNDLGNKMRLRFKNAKDFDNLIQRLEKEDYKIYIRGNTRKIKNNIQHNGKDFYVSFIPLFEIIVKKDNKRIVNVLFENNRNIESEYKQNIVAIYY